MNRALWILMAGCTLMIGGCAKYPTGTNGAVAKRVTFTLTVVGSLNPNYIYIVALNPSDELNPTTVGPEPVIAPPWGNGFVAGGCTYFVQWNPNVTPAYGIFQFTDATLNNFVQTGSPITYIDVQSGGHTINFTLDLSQIAGSVDLANDYQSLQVNFLTMDSRPQGSTGGSKNWDALGGTSNPGTINDYITVPLRTDGTYDSNYYAGTLPSDNVSTDGDPALSISNFSVQVSG